MNHRLETILRDEPKCHTQNNPAVRQACSSTPRLRVWHLWRGMGPVALSPPPPLARAEPPNPFAAPMVPLISTPHYHQGSNQEPREQFFPAVETGRSRAKPRQRVLANAIFLFVCRSSSEDGTSQIYAVPCRTVSSDFTSAERNKQIPRLLRLSRGFYDGNPR